MEEKPLSLSTKVQPPFDAMSTCFLELWYPGTCLLPIFWQLSSWAQMNLTEGWWPERNVSLLLLSQQDMSQEKR